MRSTINPTAGQLPAEGAASSFSPLLLWALLGGLSGIFSFAIFGQWLFSATEFRPIELTAADALPAGYAFRLRLVEGISVLVAAWALYHYLLRPWLQRRELAIEGLLLIGALITYVLDTSINFFGYFMAWNKHAVNFGTWGSFFPGHSGPTRYAEALLWGPPMYVYFGVALASIQRWVITGLRRLMPLGFFAALLLSFPAVFLFDLIAESVIIRQQAYAWPNTVGALTLWPGTLHQFPLYESLLVGIYASMYSWLLHSAGSDGVTFIERGAERYAGAAQHTLRLLAATGYAALCTVIYFGGFAAFSAFADNSIALPAYLMFVD